eukprot:TRINITY_DN9454_c1_g1_i1.p1 TRINITY_DN9454_c1_g1~~TRINITY_DN9454_c1_g1_i1.p1  ORF type:complete len:139 (+),score=47.28 TRINITY_DN9454_c1_g1_i1:142-558(+)
MNDESYTSRVTEVLKEDKYMYAVAQGILAVECRSDDQWTLDLLKNIADPLTTQVALAERALLRGLEGGCHVPLAVRTATTDDTITLTGAVYSLDGQEHVQHTMTAPLAEAEQLGARVADHLATEGAKEILAALHAEKK